MLQKVENQIKITYTREPFDPNAEDWPRTIELLNAHAMELRGMKIDLDIDNYLRIQKQGRLVIIKARDENGLLQGYSCHFWHRHLHFNIRVAQDDAWYVVPELRNQGIGAALLKMAHDELKKDGVKLVYGRLKAAHPHDGSMKELGYTQWEHVWLLKL